ncbi:hypothetical protein pb186bvf_018856 [Paramecium bursaria]
MIKFLKQNELIVQIRQELNIPDNLYIIIQQGSNNQILAKNLNNLISDKELIQSQKLLIVF